MKFNSHRSTGTAVGSSSVESISTETSVNSTDLGDMTIAPPADARSVRIMVSIDVPASALAEIEADWALVTATQNDAPDLVSAVVGTALARLQQHALQVNGVAMAERLPDPFTRWLRAA